MSIKFLPIKTLKKLKNIYAGNNHANVSIKSRPCSGK